MEWYKSSRGNADKAAQNQDIWEQEMRMRGLGDYPEKDYRRPGRSKEESKEKETDWANLGPKVDSLIGTAKIKINSAEDQLETQDAEGAKLALESAIEYLRKASQQLDTETEDSYFFPRV